jgi:outer membrane receptor protein involved in Fe transport
MRICRIIFYFASLFIYAAQLKASDSKQLDSISKLSLDDIMSIKVDVGGSQPSTVEQLPYSITVFTNSDIVKYNFLNLAEALEAIAGVTIYRSYIKRDLLTSRGIAQDNYANKVLVMIDRIPAWNAVTGESNLQRIPISAIERIEVLRGPASVAYGTNAYSGVVNIVLKKSSGGISEVAAIYGNNSYASISALNISNIGELEMLVSVSANDHAGFPSVFTDEEGEQGSYREYINTSSGTFAARYKGSEIIANKFRSNESFLGSVPSFSRGAGYPQLVEGHLLSYTSGHKIGKLSVNSHLSYDSQLRQISRDREDEVRTDISGYILSAGASVSVPIAAAVNAEIGADNHYRHSRRYNSYYKLSGEAYDRIWKGAVFPSASNMDNVSTSEQSARAVLSANTGKISAAAGSRLTYSRNYGTNISSSLSVLSRLAKTSAALHSAKLMFAESYRSPSLFETNFEYPSVFGNPLLKPETSSSIEGSYIRSAEKLHIQICSYYAYYQHTINRSTKLGHNFGGQQLDSVHYYYNGSPFGAWGLETEIRYGGHGPITGFLNLDYSKQASGSQYNMRHVPNWNISAGICAEKGWAAISAAANMIGATHGVYEKIPVQADISASVSASHKLRNKKISHAIFIKNISGRQRQIPQYARKTNINSVPSGLGRLVGFSMSVKLE